jgi:serine/threonine-protein kinase HipA
MRKAQVYYKNEFAGILSESDEGYLFQYDTDYLANAQSKPVSLTLPLQHKAYSSKILFPFFDGLIPEGWLLKIALDNWKIKQSDRFGLLLTLCKDSIGCVSIISI